MATIAKLVLQIEAETRSVRQQLGAATRAVNQFARDMDRAFAKIPTLSQATGAGAGLLRTRLAGVRQELNDTVRDLRAALRGKFIDRDEFARQMQVAIRAAREKSRAAVNELQALGFIDQQQANAAVRASNAAAKRSQEQLTQGNRTVREAQRIVDRLEAGFQTREAALIADRAVGALTKKQYETRARENAAAYNLALAAEMERLAGRGRLTEPIRRALTTKFKPEGFGAGAAASAAEQAMSRATRTVDLLQQRFERSVTKARLDLANKAISPEAFERRAFQAGQAFDRGLITALGRMRAAGQMSDEVERFLTRRFKVIGKKNADEGVFAARDYVSRFRDEYNRAISTARFAQLSGDINTAQFAKASKTAAEQFNRALREVRDRLDREGLLTPAAQAFLNKQFVNAGKLSGTSFRQAFNDALKVENIASLRQLGQTVSNLGGQLTRFLSVPVAGLGVGAVKLAADAEQAGRRLLTTFGPNVVKLERDLARLRNSVPATSAELKNMAAQLGELFIPLKIAPDVVAGMSIELIKATKNIAVFSGASTARAFNAVINGIIGQSRELKKLGVEIDARTIRDEAYRRGIARVGSVLSTTQTIQAAYHVVLQRTGLITNALADQQDTFNVRMQFFVARLKDAGISIGTVILPALTTLVDFLGSVAQRFSSMDESQRRWVVGLALAAAAIGPLLILIGNLIKAFALYRAAVTAASVATALGGAGAAAGGALGLGGILAVGGPVVAVLGAIAAALVAYKIAAGDASKTTSVFTSEIAGMSKEALEASRTALKQAEDQALAARQRLRVEAGVTEGPGGLVVGGTIADRKQFISLGEDVQRWRAELELVEKEITKINVRQTEANALTKTYEARVRAAQEAVNEDLLVEALHRSTRELSRVSAAAAEAGSAIRLATRLKDPELMAEGFEKAQSALSRVNSLIQTFNETRADPEFAKIADDMDALIDRAQKLQNNLKGLTVAAENTKVFSEFARRLANVRAAFALGIETRDPTALARGFKLAESLATDLGTALAAADEKGLTKTSERIQSIIDQLDTLVARTTRVSPAQFIRTMLDDLRTVQAEVDDLLSRIDAARPGAEREALVGQLPALTAKLLEGERAINEVRQKGIGTERENNLLLRERLDLQERVRKAAAVQFKIADVFAPGLEETLRELGDRRRAVQLRLDVEFDADAQRKLQTQLDALDRRAAEAIKRVQESFTFSLLPADVQTEVIRQIGDMMKDAGFNARTLNDETKKTGDQLARWTVFARGVADVADALGLGSQEARSMARSIANLIDGIQQLKAARESLEGRQDRQAETNPFAAPVGANLDEIAATVGGIVAVVGAVASVANLLNQAFSGQSQAQQEANAIMRENNERLGEMRLALEGFTASIGQQLAIGRALGSPRVAAAAEAFNLARFFSGAEKAQRAFDASLAGTGVTLARLQKIAAENGIQLLDSKGRIVVGALEQLAEAIGINVQLLTRYGNTLDEQQRKIDLWNNVFDVPDDPNQTIRDQVALLQQLAPELFERFFAGVDLSDAEAVERAVRAMTTALLSGAIDLDDFGGLLGKEELEQIILGLEGGLDALNDAARRAAGELLNVPDVFKVAAARFAAQDPVNQPVDTARLGFREGQGGPFEPGAGGQGGDTNVVVENVTIDAKDRSLADAGEELLQWLRDRKYARTGSTVLHGIDDDRPPPRRITPR